MIVAIEVPPRPWVRSFGVARGQYGDVLAHPDGERVIAMDRDGTVTVWRIADGVELARLPALLSGYELDDARDVSLLLHPDGVRLFATVVIMDTSDVCLCWNLERGELVESYAYPRVPHAFIGERCAITGQGLGLTIWDLATSEPVNALHRDDASWGVLGMLDRDHVLIRARDAVEVWDVRAATRVWSIEGDARIAGEFAVVMSAGQLEVRERDGTVVREHACAPGLGLVAVDRGATVAILAGATALVAMDLETGAVRSQFASVDPYVEVAVAVDARHATVGGAVWELATGACLLRAPYPLVLARDGAHAFGRDGARLRLHALDGAEVIDAPLPAFELSTTVGSRDGRREAIRNGTTIELWRTGEPPLRQHTFRSLTEATCAAFDETGGWLVSGHVDGALLVRDAAARAHHATLLGADRAVRAVAIRAGRIAATDGALALWDLERGELVDRYVGDDDILDVTWRDDTTLACTTARGIVVLRVG